MIFWQGLPLWRWKSTGVKRGLLEVDNNHCNLSSGFASGYALKDVSVFYMMKMYPEVFARLERSWDGDERSYCHVNILIKFHVVYIELF